MGSTRREFVKLAAAVAVGARLKPLGAETVKAAES